MIIAITIFILFFLGLALIHLDWAVLLLIASLPAYLIRFNVGGLPLTLLEVMILIAFGVWFYKFFLPDFKASKKRQEKRWPYPYAKEIILVIVISFLAAGVSGFSINALGIWKAYFFEPILFFLLIFNVFKDKKELNKIFWAFLISMGAVSALAIFQKITGLLIANPFWAAAESRRIVSFFGYPNAVGLYLAPLIMLVNGWLFSLPWKNICDQIGKKLIIITIIIASLLAIYFARSEGALIGLAAALFVFGLSAGKKLRIFTLSLLIIGTTIVFTSKPIQNFIWTKISLQDLSGEIRQQQWKETLTMLKNDRIISGAGLNNYQAAIKPYHQEGIFFNSDKRPNFDAVVWASSTLRTKYWQPVEIYLYPHNIWLNFWSELGLLGAIIFMWLIGKYLLQATKLYTLLKRQENSERYLILGLATAMITILVHGLVDVPYFKNDLAAMFWLLFALLGIFDLNYGVRRQKK